MSDIRICNTADLTELNRRAIDQRFNRAVTDEFIGLLDPEGNHILSLVLWGHNIDSAAILHHRMQALCKVKGSDDPTTVIIDVADTDWKRLTAVDKFKATLASVD